MLCRQIMAAVPGGPFQTGGFGITCFDIDSVRATFDGPEPDALRDKYR